MQQQCECQVSRITAALMVLVTIHRPQDPALNKVNNIQQQLTFLSTSPVPSPGLSALYAQSPLIPPGIFWGWAQWINSHTAAEDMELGRIYSPGHVVLDSIDMELGDSSGRPWVGCSHLPSRKPDQGVGVPMRLIPGEFCLEVFSLTEMYSRYL